ncbi:MAG: LemA family protein [Planctomycetes bacterium]|nr:LemA family protein [Planctomycetota bacterium]
MQRIPSTSPRRGAIARGCLVAIAVVLLLVLAVGGCAVGQYNGIASAKKNVDGRLAEIDNQYKRRFDLIPQLVDTVKGAANYEKTTLQAVVDARASVGKIALPAEAASDPEKLKSYLAAQDQLGGALSRLLAVAEAYPDLKASQNFLGLQSQIEGTENRITVARRDYVDAVQDYNTRIVKFPGLLFASMFNYRELPQFTTDPSQQAAPKIDFGTQK